MWVKELKMSTLEAVRAQYNKLAADFRAATAVVENTKAQLEGAHKKAAVMSATSRMLKKIIREVQGEFKGEVDKVVTMAVRAVFDERYKFDLEIKTGGQSLQCRPVIWEKVEGQWHEFTPKDDMGGSIIDPMALALRTVLQQYDPEPTRASMWLDEPMKNVGKGELLLKAGQLIAEVSHGLNIQMIIITHEPELAEIADRAWRVMRRKNGRSVVTLIKGGIPKRQIIK
jgi:DNA repair ATPase RecN